MAIWGITGCDLWSATVVNGGGVDVLGLGAPLQELALLVLHTLAGVGDGHGIVPMLALARALATLLLCAWLQRQARAYNDAADTRVRRHGETRGL